MKAVVITRLGGPEVLEIRDVPEPVPNAGEELVRVEAAWRQFCRHAGCQWRISRHAASDEVAKFPVPKPRNSTL